MTVHDREKEEDGIQKLRKSVVEIGQVTVELYI